MAGKELVSDDTATRIGAGFGAVAGFVIGGVSGSLAGAALEGKGKEAHVGVGVLGAVLGSAAGAYLGVPSGTCLSPEKATVGTSGLHNPRFP